MRKRHLRTLPDPDQIEAELVGLAALDLDALRALWLKNTGQPAPRALRRDTLSRALAARMQTEALGGLSREAARLLDRLATAQDPSAVLRAEQDRRLKPGTLLVRKHAGVLHRVTVQDEGYAWNGATYASLSEVARAITGTRWNGPRFFGLHQRARAKTRTDEARP